jgi:hypothetical protein
MTMAALDALKLIGAANAEISNFLQNAPTLPPPYNQPAPNLSEVQEQVAALMVTVQNVGQRVKAAQLTSVDERARAEIDLYARNLDRLKQFLTALRSHAEARRDQLLAQFGKIQEVLAWCDAVKRSNLD